MLICKTWYGLGIVGRGIRMGQPMDLLLVRGVAQRCISWRQSEHHVMKITTSCTGRGIDLRSLEMGGARSKDRSRTCHGTSEEHIPSGEISPEKFHEWTRKTQP